MFGKVLSNFTLNHPNTRSLLLGNRKFDLVIVEIFACEALIGFGQHFSAPVIGLSTFGASLWTTKLGHLHHYHMYHIHS